MKWLNLLVGQFGPAMMGRSFRSEVFEILISAEFCLDMAYVNTSMQAPAPSNMIIHM